MKVFVRNQTLHNTKQQHQWRVTYCESLADTRQSCGRLGATKQRRRLRDATAEQSRQVVDLRLCVSRNREDLRERAKEKETHATDT